MDQNEIPRLGNIQEMAKILGVNKNWLYRRTMQGGEPLPCYRIGRHIRFDPKTVLAYFARSGTGNLEEGSVS